MMRIGRFGINSSFVKRTILFSLLFFLIRVPGHSQDGVVVIHPVVGELIDKEEKKAYLLFPEFNDSLFYYCFVKSVNGKYSVTARFQGDSVLVKEIDLSTLKEYRTHVEKLNLYYSERAKGRPADQARDKNIPEQERVSQSTLQKRIITPGTKEWLRKENERDARLKQDEEWMRLKKQGIDDYTIDISDFFSPGK